MSIPKPAAYTVVSVALLIAGGLVYFNAVQSGQEPDRIEQTFSKKARTEEELTVQRTAQCLVDFGALAAKRQELVQVATRPGDVDDKGARRYTVSFGKVEALVNLVPGVWSPESYLALAARALPAKSSVETTPENALTCARTLLSPKIEVLLGENRRISELLNQRPDSSAAHVEAALLLGTIALNEYSNRFNDTRIFLDRVVAHLAAARHWGVSTEEPAFRLAEAIRLTLCGQQRDALEWISGWGGDAALDGAMKEWRILLRLRNTMDWRNLRETAGKGSFALKCEYFRALARTINATRAMQFLEEIKAAPEPAYWYIAHETRLGVSEGHVFAKPLFEVNLRDIAAAAKEFGVEPSEKDVAWLADYLDEPEGSPVLKRAGESSLKCEVAGKNLMAGWQQRRLMSCLAETYRFLSDMWGVNDMARDLKRSVANDLPALRYKPFLIRMMGRKESERLKANEECAKVIEARKEMVPPSLWIVLVEDQRMNRIALPMPEFHTWFRPEVPYGTAFEMEPRLHSCGLGDENDPLWMKELWERAPYDFDLGLHNASIEGGGSHEKIPPSAIEKWLGAQLPYSVKPLRRLAAGYRTQPARYEEAMLRLAELDPDAYSDLAGCMVEFGQPENAAKYYLLSFEKSEDRVCVANESRWIVRYLYEHGDHGKALEIASDAAKVFSSRGLRTYVWLMEQENRWKDALETCEKIDKRYHDSKPVETTALAIRMQAEHAEEAARLGLPRHTAQIFPEGIKRVELKDFSGPPAKGVRFKERSRRLEAFGLREGMVVVALDGYQVGGFDQYDVIRSATDDPRMTIIAWNGAAYTQAEGEVPERKFGVDMEDYTGQ